MNKLSKEYSKNNRWNPFNSFKLLTHVNRWEKIEKGKDIPPPILVTVDPSNQCNISCVWCNAKKVIEQRKTQLSTISLNKISEFLINWTVNNYKVEAVCIAGGGEPLLNKNIGNFIEKLINGGIQVGVTTNGILIDKYIDVLSKCSWVSVSIDAGTRDTYAKLKQTTNKNFDKVINNIKMLSDYSINNNTPLYASNPYQGICWKHLIFKGNISEILTSAKIAHEIGCRSVLYRPAGITWFGINNSQKDNELTFNDNDIELIEDQLNKANILENNNFYIFSLTSRFGNKLQISNSFNRCYAVFMTAYITPPYQLDHQDSAVFSLCCDWRGNPKLELKREVLDFKEIQRLWGSDQHWKIQEYINPNNCPRCTFKPHNEIFENVILKDTISKAFI